MGRQRSFCEDQCTNVWAGGGFLVKLVPEIIMGWSMPPRFLDNLFSIAYKNTLAERCSMRPSNSLDFRHCRHKTLHLLAPPSSAARVAPPRLRGTTLTL